MHLTKNDRLRREVNLTGVRQISDDLVYFYDLLNFAFTHLVRLIVFSKTHNNIQILCLTKVHTVTEERL